MATASSDWAALVAALFRQNQFAIKYDLDAMHAAVVREGLERVAPRVVLVAGTNGKGSTAAALHALARRAGWDVGLYTSPHLISVRERARLNGTPIGEADAQRHLAHVMREYSGQERPAWGARALSYFELTTLWALRWFKERAPDLVILEVGLGGRLDATNVIERDVTVITSVGMDHQQWLGETLAAIASEKAGICREGLPVVLHRRSGGFAEARAAAEARRAIVHVAEAGDDPGAWAASLARGVLSLVPSPPTLSPLDVAGALSEVRWPGRRQSLVRDGRLVLLDGAHNPPAIAASVRWLHRELGGRKIPILAGLTPDRDPSLLAPYRVHASAWHLTQAESGRAAAPDALHGAWTGGVDAHEHSNVRDALAATSEAPVVAVVGSLYLVGDALSALGETAESLSLTAERTAAVFEDGFA